MTDFIGRYYLENTSLCDEAIKWFKENKKLAVQGHIGDKDGVRYVDENVKESNDISLTLEEYYQHGEFFQKIFDFLWEGIQDYIKKYEELGACCFTIDGKINFQHYVPPKGGFKKYHCERATLHVSPRCLVWMIYLNTLEDDGGTEFKYYNCIEKAEKGKLLIWPPDFTHTHRGLTSETEEKYILTGWYKFI